MCRSSRSAAPTPSRSSPSSISPYFSSISTLLSWVACSCELLYRLQLGAVHCAGTKTFVAAYVPSLTCRCAHHNDGTCFDACFIEDTSELLYVKVDLFLCAGPQRQTMTLKFTYSEKYDLCSYFKFDHCMLRFETAAYLHGVTTSKTTLARKRYCEISMRLKMLYVSAWVAAAFLLLTRAHAALTLHSSVGNKPCNVQYIVLHASISSSCVDQCSLLLRSAAEPQLVSAQGNSGLDVISTSTLLPTNVVTFQQVPADRHILQISCQADSDCTASPKSWQVEKIGSGLLLAAQGAGHFIDSTSQANCVQEVNSTVSIGKALDIFSEETDKHAGTKFNAVLTWSIRAAVLASLVMLQMSSR